MLDCDYIFHGSELMYSMVGSRAGATDTGTVNGVLSIGMDFRRDFMRWYIGACDHHWSDLSSLRYTYIGGICEHGLDCGSTCLNVFRTHEHAN